MSPHKLPNYLRTYRKRAALTQAEVAFLLGCHSAEQVSRYEHFHRIPSYHTILAYKVVFRIPTSELFGGEYEKVERAVRRRARLLALRLIREKPDQVTARKLAVLKAIGKVVIQRNQP